MIDGLPINTPTRQRFEPPASAGQVDSLMAPPLCDYDNVSKISKSIVRIRLAARSAATCIQDFHPQREIQAGEHAHYRWFQFNLFAICEIGTIVNENRRVAVSLTTDRSEFDVVFVHKSFKVSDLLPILFVRIRELPDKPRALTWLSVNRAWFTAMKNNVWSDCFEVRQKRINIKCSTVNNQIGAMYFRRHHLIAGRTFKVTCPRSATGFRSVRQHFGPPATAGQVDRLVRT